MAEVQLKGATSGESILKAPAVAGSNTTITLPKASIDLSTAGTDGQFLKTDGAGTLSFATPTDTTTPANDTVTAAKLDLSIVQGDIIYGTGTDTWAKLAKGTADQVLTMNTNATAPEWAAAGGGGAFSKVYRKTTTTSTAMNSGNDPVQVGGASMEIEFTPPASTTSYLAHYSGQIHSGTDDGQWAPQFRISEDNYSNYTSINFVHNTYGFEDTEKQRRQENWWREFKPGNTNAWKIRVYASVHSSESVDITFSGWGGVNALTLYELVDSAKSGDWG